MQNQTLFTVRFVHLVCREDSACSSCGVGPMELIRVSLLASGFSSLALALVPGILGDGTHRLWSRGDVLQLSCSLFLLQNSLQPECFGPCWNEEQRQEYSAQLLGRICRIVTPGRRQKCGTEWRLAVSSATAAATFSITPPPPPLPVPLPLLGQFICSKIESKNPLPLLNNSLLLLGSDKTLIKAVVAPQKPAGACCRLGPLSLLPLLSPSCIQLHLAPRPTSNTAHGAEGQAPRGLCPLMHTAFGDRSVTNRDLKGDFLETVLKAECFFLVPC